MVLAMQHESDADLPEVRRAHQAIGSMSRPRDAGHQQAREDHHDGEHDEQFDHAESACTDRQPVRAGSKVRHGGRGWTQ